MSRSETRSVGPTISLNWVENNVLCSSPCLQAHEKDVTYPGLVQFALSLTDSLLFVHYLALILIELRHRRQQFYVKVSTI